MFQHIVHYLMLILVWIRHKEGPTHFLFFAGGAAIARGAAEAVPWPSARRAAPGKSFN